MLREIVAVLRMPESSYVRASTMLGTSNDFRGMRAICDLPRYVAVVQQCSCLAEVSEDTVTIKLVWTTTVGSNQEHSEYFILNAEEMRLVDPGLYRNALLLPDKRTVLQDPPPLYELGASRHDFYEVAMLVLRLPDSPRGPELRIVKTISKHAIDKILEVEKKLEGELRVDWAYAAVGVYLLLHKLPWEGGWDGVRWIDFETAVSMCPECLDILEFAIRPNWLP